MHPLFDKDEQMMNRVCSVDRIDKYQSQSQDPKMKFKNNSKAQKLYVGKCESKEGIIIWCFSECCACLQNLSKSVILERHIHSI